MQSLLQYRRLRRQLERDIKQYGPRVAAGDPRYQPTGDILEDPEDVILELQLRQSRQDPRAPSKLITLHNGVRIHVPGVDVQSSGDDTSPEEETVFLVGFDNDGDPLDPKNWPKHTKWATFATVGSMGFVVGWSSAIDSAVIKQGQEAFGVSKVTESLATALYLIAFALGSLIAAPFSETVGRNPVYIITLTVFATFVMASGLSPNIGAQLAFRFLAGFAGCTPLTAIGGSMSDLFGLLERTYLFPLYACLSFLGPFLAPMVGSFIGESAAISWRWTEWLTLIMAGVLVAIISLFVPETYGPMLLKWKAAHLRSITGDSRFIAEMELRQTSILSRLLGSCSRPFRFFFSEIMVALFTFYLVVVYIVLFGFLTGYDYVFGGQQFHLTQGLTGTAFLGMNVGFLIALLIVPLIYRKYKRDFMSATEAGHHGLPAEQRLWFSMYGAPWLPASLFCMAWTNYASATPWPSLVASAAFGFSVQGIFISTYMYLIDSYEEYAASALVSATFARYVASGAMVVASIPMYENLGVHWSLTLLGCISLLMTPVPYVFYRYGHTFRLKSKNAKAAAS